MNSNLRLSKKSGGGSCFNLFWAGAFFYCLTASAFAQSDAGLIDVIALPSTTSGYSGGSGSLSSSFGASYAGVTGGTANPAAYFYFPDPITVQNLTFTFYLHCRSYGNDSDHNTLSFDVQWNNGAWEDVPNASGYVHQDQYHDALDTWYDPAHGNTTVTLTGLNLTNCSALSISLYSSSNDPKKGNCSGEAYLYAFQALAENNSIVANPQSANVLIGNAAQFSFAAQSGAQFSYQWYFKKDETATGLPITSATSANLTIPAAIAANEGYYFAQASNGFGTLISSDAQLVVSAPILFIARDNNGNVDLKWTNLFTGPLIYAATLVSPASWNPVPITPINTNGQYEVVIFPDAKSAFFGLGEPASLTNTTGLK